jgi:hypothetical protein
MGFDDIGRLSIPGHFAHDSDLVDTAAKKGNLEGLGGNRHGANIQETAARWKSVASGRQLGSISPNYRGSA